jgi:hypothetical protein
MASEENPGVFCAAALHAFLAALLMATACRASADSAPVVDWFAYAQLTAEHSDDDFEFGADRVRAGFGISADRVSGRLQLDFNAGDLDTRPPGTLPNLIKDVFVEYRMHEQAAVRLGQFKMPLGMDFLLAGHSLDITKRGMEKALVLERGLGMMLSGRRLPGGFGYDVGIFNPAGRASATAHTGAGPDDQTGKDHAWAARLQYEPVREWHAEAAIGRSESAGGPGTADYDVVDIGIRFAQQPWTVKAEYIAGRDVRGERGRDERVWYVHFGYAVTSSTEVVVRHYQGRSEASTGNTSLGNAYFGLTHSLGGQRGFATRLQLNYVAASGDRVTWGGLSGFRDDALLLQVQFAYLP